MYNPTHIGVIASCVRGVPVPPLFGPKLRPCLHIRKQKEIMEKLKHKKSLSSTESVKVVWSMSSE